MGSIVWIFSFEPYHSDWMLELYELLGALLPQTDDVVKSGLFFCGQQTAHFFIGCLKILINMI